MLFFIKIIFLIFQSNFKMYKNNFTKFGQKNHFFNYCYSTSTVRFLTVATVHMTVTTMNLTIATVPLKLINSSKFILESIHCTYCTSKTPKSSQVNLQTFQGFQKFIVHLPKSHKAKGEKKIAKSNPIFFIQIEVTIYLFI